MSDKPYIRNSKAIIRGKWGITDEDIEDFEQEQLIKNWISQSGTKRFDYKYINRKGNARNTLSRNTVSLDEKVRKDSSTTFESCIAGSDGRDLESRGESNENSIDPREKIHGDLSALGFNKKEIICLLKILKASLIKNN